MEISECKQALSRPTRVDRNSSAWSIGRGRWRIREERKTEERNKERKFFLRDNIFCSNVEKLGKALKMKERK